MSTTTAPAEIPVPRDLVPVLRENTVRILEALGHDLSYPSDAKPFDGICDEMARAIAAYRAFAADADAYPADAVRLAATEAMEDAESRIADDSLTVDKAEFYVRRVRACEKLREMAA